MLSIKRCAVPAHTMLDGYSRDGGYTDCYTTEISAQISLARYVSAFYTTFIFKLERFLLKWLVSKPSTDDQAKQLSDGTSGKFAAWYVEKRNENEILMCDFRGRTRSWLMVAPISMDSDIRTRLYFGSAIVPIRNSKTGELSLVFGYQALLGFHKVYSVLLLYFAKSRILRELSNMS